MNIRFLFLLFILVCQNTFAQWNNWGDAASVRRNLHEAQNQGYSYFSQFHIYDVRSNNIHSSIFCEQTNEVPYIYALDFYYASGTYFSENYQQQLRKNILEVIKKQWCENKAISSFSWHLENPYVDSSFDEYMGCRFRYGQKKMPYPEEHRYVIREILSGKGGNLCGEGKYNYTENNSLIYKNPSEWFDDRCKEVADIINEFIDDNGKPIPFIFRLWHECEDQWMWWGSSSVSVEDYKSFFIYTQKMIKKYAPKAQILWAYCTDRNWNTEDEFMLRYPGDQYVDIIGYDDYEIGDPKKVLISREKARIVTKAATAHKKVAALFETSDLDEKTYDRFYSNYLFPLLMDSDVNLSLVQMWINEKFDKAPQYDDRKRFLKQPIILMIDSL